MAQRTKALLAVRRCVVLVATFVLAPVAVAWDSSPAASATQAQSTTRLIAVTLPESTALAFRAIVTGGSPSSAVPTGTVSFSIDGSGPGSGPVDCDGLDTDVVPMSSGVATCKVESALPSSGPTTADAAYSGDDNYTASDDTLTSSDGSFTPGGGPSPTPPSSGGPSPAAAPVAWCETGLPQSPYSSPPAGAVTIPAGDDSNTPPAQSYTVQPNTIYWLAPGIHTIGSNEFAQFEGAAGDTFVGAPGAVLDGQDLNDFAVAGDQSSDTDNVTVEYLTIENFTAGSGEAVVGQDAADGWTVKDDLIENNPFGAGAALTTDGTVTDNCLQKNGEYGFTAEGENGTENHVTLTNNDINDNNVAGYYDIPGSTQQCGCSGGGKFWQTIDATVTGNYIHNNLGPGIWVDTANAGFNISHNYIANNWASAVVYEISYNANISDNTLVGNDWGEVQTNASPSFPAGAIYISNSGGDSRVSSDYAGHITISGNTLSQNWGGIVLYQDANRICGFSADGECTLVDPSVYTLSSCAANITASSSPSQSPDYYDNCQWKTQNVSVTDNTMSFDPDTLPNVQSGGESCATANTNEDTLCGYNGLFSYYGQVGPFTGTEQDSAVSDRQNNVFSDNTYSGPIGFSAFNQGNNVPWSQWNQGFSYSGGGSFDAQDAGSAYTP